MEVKLKNVIIKNLLENGLMNTTDHSLSAAHAYKVFKFRDEISKAGEAIEDKRKKLVKDVIGENPDFDKRRKELLAIEKPTEEESKELAEMNEKLNKFAELYTELMNDESTLNIKKIPFEEYHLLANENKQTPLEVPTGETGKNGTPKTRQIFIDFFTVWRSTLKDVLWEEPTDED